MGWTLRTEGDWERSAQILRTLPERATRALQAAFVGEAEFFRKKILQGFAQGGPDGAPWRPLSAMTIAVRTLLGNKKTKLLQQSGDLRNSISVVPVEGVGVFVGVSRMAVSKSKLGAVNLAMLHEGGASFSVLMTPKMRALLAMAAKRAGLERPAPRGRGAPKGEVRIQITIPARPFLGPVFERYGNPADIEASVLARMARILGGDVGRPDSEPRS